MSTPTGSQTQRLTSDSDSKRRSGVILCCRDAGGDWPNEQYKNLKSTLEERISCLVSIVHSIAEPESIAGEMERLVQQGVEEITFVPVSQLPLNGAGAIAHVSNWATRQWPDLQIQIAPPLSWAEIGNWIFSTIQTAVKEFGAASESIAVLLCGSGSNDSLRNADLARLAHLLYERSTFFRVNSAFLSEIRPTIEEVMDSVCLEPIQNIFIVPWQLSDLDEKRFDSVRSTYAGSTEKCVRVVEMQLTNSAMVNLLIANYLAAAPLEEERRSVPTESAMELTEAEQFELQQLRSRIDELLPSEYQGRYETVSPQSMGTAKLKTDDAGQVAWDQIWTSFCDLALAGGPPHRGKLLEAVTSEEALAEPEAYQSVVDEIRRGIGLVTHLTTFESPIPGWIGIQCDSEEMATWLMRAIIVENVMVRRERANLFLPAGPKFTVSKEIKNVITSVAKTVHYWKSHLKSQQRGIS